MKVVSVTNQKGGCGKTITAVNFAAALARKGIKVLLIDLDPQAHATYALGYKDTSEKNILRVFDCIIQNGSWDLKEFLWEKSANLSFLASTMELSALEQELKDSQYSLEILNKLIDQAEPMGFEYIVVDCPPSLGFLTLNALKSCDTVLVPLDTSLFSLVGLDSLLRVASLTQHYSDRLPNFYYLVTIFDKRSNFAKRFMETVNEQFSDKLLTTIIRNNVHLRESALLGKTIFEHDAASNGAKDYASLVDEILAKDRAKRTVEFRCEAPQAQKVYITGDFNNWRKEEKFSLVPSDGIWRKKVSLPRGAYNYKFIIDDTWTHDKANPQLQDDSYGGLNSIITIQ